MIHSSTLPLFADIGRFNALSETKTIMSSAQANDYLISLGSLLDRRNAESVRFEQYYIEAIPFKGEFCSDAVSITSQHMENPTADSLSCSKIFYVNTLDTQTDTTDLMVVTMIPSREYLSEHSVSEIKYLDKPNFSGMILYSDIDGTFREALYFKSGLILPMSPVEPGDCIDDNEEVYHLATYERSETKATQVLIIKFFSSWIVTIIIDDAYYLGELEGATCSASGGGGGSGTQKKTDQGKDDNKDQGKDDEKKDNPTTGKGGGGGGGGGDVNKDRGKNEKQRHRVYLTAQMTSPTESSGTVSGNGTYVHGTFVSCSAAPNQHYVFNGWTGNMPGSGPYVTFVILGDISATATFSRLMEEPTKRPCWDYETNIANVLVDMRVAPTNNGSLNNGIFSLYNPSRIAGKHQGIDLAAEVGTPIFAPCDGVISKNSAFVTGQPQRLKNGEYPKGYTGDDNDAGNRFYLDCNLPSGERITYAFFHLQAGTPVAINPRTGRTFKQGDAVYQGDIIGYVGRTGNAYNIQNTHLHLGVRDSYGRWIDPVPYLNGSLQIEGGKVISAKFKEVDCDDKSRLDEISPYN